MGVRWVSVSVRGMLRGCGAVNRARRRAGLLRRTDSGVVQSERARKTVSMHIKGGFKQTFFMAPAGGCGPAVRHPVEMRPCQ